MAKAAKHKVCKNCKRIYSSSGQCPLCKSTNNSNIWRGTILVINHKKSQVAKKLSINDDGLFALRVK